MKPLLKSFNIILTLYYISGTLTGVKVLPLQGLKKGISININ